ncbi:MAG TPA: S41 family peptidase [Allosphingosinicella sp.]|nr:S41 family peptidase [Allosphingosinicella sp.]
MKIGKWLVRLGGGLATVLALAAAADIATYDAKAWGADFERLKSDMAQGYANLEWIAEHRRIDLAALSRQTAGELDGAHSRVRAFFALQRFLDRFGDPHLQLAPPDGESGPRAAAAGAGPPTDPAVADCGAAGYEEGEHGFGLSVERLPGWRPLAGGNFPTGLAGATGFLRIAQFGENQYLSACTARFRPGIGRRALQLEVRAALQEELRSRLAQLRRAGAKGLLVDLSGNGGGSEWVSEAVPLFTARRLERQAPRRIGPACDRRGLWEGKRPTCSVFAAAEPPMRIAGEGDWPGPLLVLIDGGTASASEDFVAWMKDNEAARLIGARTYGAGCGYVDGGTRTRLRVLPRDVRMPNCARFLRDGANEIEGIAPDVALPMDDPEKTAAALAGLLAE